MKYNTILLILQNKKLIQDLYDWQFKMRKLRYQNYCFNKTVFTKNIIIIFCLF